MNKWLRLAGWIVIWITAMFFLQGGVQKIAGWGEMIRLFHELGYPDWFRVVVGILEVIGAVLLVFPRLTLYGATGFTILMLGAVISEWRAGHLFQIMLAGQWLVISMVIVWVRLRMSSKSKQQQKNRR